ncbi:MAG: hypothetical protein IJT43_06200 [Stomatobaculum sp.]|nr:hypothetical protein [Stomatobaculum sp.]
MPLFDFLKKLTGDIFEETDIKETETSGTFGEPAVQPGGFNTAAVQPGHPADKLEAQYEKALRLIRENEHDPEALLRSLEKFEAELTQELDAAQIEASALEERAKDAMSGNEVEVLFNMMSMLSSVKKLDDLDHSPENTVESRIPELKKELQERAEAASGETLEQIQRIQGLLEGLGVSEEVLGKMGQIF